jgi:hypothetical protein
VSVTQDPGPANAMSRAPLLGPRCGDRAGAMWQNSNPKDAEDALSRAAVLGP